MIGWSLDVRTFETISINCTNEDLTEWFAQIRPEQIRKALYQKPFKEQQSGSISEQAEQASPRRVPAGTISVALHATLHAALHANKSNLISNGDLMAIIIGDNRMP